MIEVKGNLWDFPADYKVITTNGAVKYDGACVMGRGCAREAKDKYPGIEYTLGSLIRDWGNHVHLLGHRKILSFPVKHHWKQKADLELIERSAVELKAFVLGMESVHPAEEQLKIVMPRPGCGNGGLEWEEVKPVIENWLDDRFYVITF